MKAVIQRVKKAKVEIEGQTVGEIGQGFLVLLGIDETDTKEDADYIIKKTVNLRVFSDSDDKMNLSVKDIEGEILLVSQFTLIADTKKGNRPSFIGAMHPSKAEPFFLKIIEDFKTAYPKIETGQFGADMAVSLLNDGPVTICLDSHIRRQTT